MLVLALLPLDDLGQQPFAILAGARHASIGFQARRDGVSVHTHTIGKLLNIQARATLRTQHLNGGCQASHLLDQRFYLL